ncbi:MAG: phosphoglycerate kinase [Bacilli bacterium]|nr:phosphoglycerate kinase [Bacilli bacterium]
MKTIKEANIYNKSVIIRFDYNVPVENGKIMDDTRIISSLKTLNYVLKSAKKVIILSHMGRVKDEEDKKKYSLKIVCDYLSKLIDKKIAFCDYTNVEETINNNEIIMMENTRFFDLDNNKESNSDEELSKYFASFGDIFINDAFGTCHRNNASNVGISKFLPSYNGFLVEEEINNLDKLLDNVKRPYTVIMGGAKVSDKLKVINNLIEKVDYLIISGGMAYTFLKVKGYNIGKSICEDEYIDYAKKLIKNYSDKIVLIEDNYIEDKSIKNIEEMDDNNIGYDIGPKTIECYKEIINKSKTVFYNGPMGLFEKGYEYGTKEILKLLNDSKAFVVIGGGDTVSAVNKYQKENHFTISTGGGASLEYLEGKKLPGVFL